MLRLYNTLTSQKEPFETAEPGHARVYVCGPTVYDYAHLGHARCYVIYDVLVRHLRARFDQVTYVRNITDIDDKIIHRAKETGEEPTALAERFRVAYDEDWARLGILPPDVEPKVSDHLKEIEELIQTLIDRGAAYESGGDVYFSVESFPGYGKLSHRKLADMELGASGRTKEAEAARKKHPADFALWKSAPEGEKSWPSRWGQGRPGWHIECSAMSMRYLGETFDLHGGGLDLVFPHHENEIAQSESATGKPFSRLWMHNGFLEVNKEKMSKSLGNFFTARELFKRVEPEAVRYFALTCHYRAPLNLDWTIDEQGNVTGFPQFEEAEHRVEYIYDTHLRLAAIGEGRIARDGGAAPAELTGIREKLLEALDDDLNFPVALSIVAAFLKHVNDLAERAKGKKGKVSEAAVRAAREGLAAIADILGLGTEDPSTMILRVRDRRAEQRGIDPGDVEAKIAARTRARAEKSFAEADRLRDELAAKGVELLDSPTGTTWRVS